MSGSNLPPLPTVFVNGNGVLADQNLNTFVQGGMLLANARLFTGVSNMTIFLIGLSYANDGNGGTFYWNATATTPDDGGATTIAPNSNAAGRWIRLSTATGLHLPLSTANGGTGLSQIPSNGQILIGNGSAYTLGTITAGSGINITSGAGSISIAAINNASVSSVQVSGGTTGLTTSGGPVTTSGTITLGGTLVPSAGGTGLTATPANGQMPIGNGSGYTLSTLTAGVGISISNSAGSVTITATGTSAAVVVINSSPITGGTVGDVLIVGAGSVVSQVSTTGTGNVVLSTSPTTNGTLTFAP
jgi:hypothetical protein